MQTLGNIASGGIVQGNHAVIDSVVTVGSSEYVEIDNALTLFVDSLNLRLYDDLTNLPANNFAGNYRLSSSFSINDNQPIKMIGSAGDQIVIKVDGDLIMSEYTNIVLDGLKPKNVIWWVTGNLNLEQNAWVYGTFFVAGDAIIDNEAMGAFSIFTDGTCTFGKTTALISNSWLDYSESTLPPIYCNDRCTLNDLVVNGSFSANPICDDTPNANGFFTDLVYKVSPFLYEPCTEPISETGYYKIDRSRGWNWNRKLDPYIGDHTGDAMNIMFVDAFRFFTNNQGGYVDDTTQNLIWGQNFSNLQAGQTYVFAFWSANINHFEPKDVPLRFLFNGAEIPYTRYKIPGDTKVTQWEQHCIQWTAPGNIGGAPASLNIQMRQVGPFTRSGSGQDFVLDDITFGLKGNAPITITVASTPNYCTGDVSIISIVDPLPQSTFQWFLNGQPISGATGTSYTANQSGVYSVQGIQQSTGCLLLSNSLQVTITPITGQFINFTASSSVTNQIWSAGASSNPFGSADGKVWIKNSLTIPAGINVTIKGMRFEFGKNARLIVQAGASLTLESENSVPTVLTSYNCANTMWQGVQLWSSAASRAQIILKAGTILEHAHIGIENRSTNAKLKVPAQGFVVATGAIFQNNNVAVRLIGKNSGTESSTPQMNGSKFSNCIFRTTASMRDQITYPSGLHRTFVDLAYIQGVEFNQNQFVNTFYLLQPVAVNNVFDEARVTTNKGITALYSSFKLQDDGLGNEFTNLWVGIDYVNSIRNPVRQNFVNCDFGSVAYGIILRGGNGVMVRECNFLIDPSFAYSNKAVPKSFIGINARGSINFTITENIFTDGYCGVLVANASRMNSVIYKNTFLGVGKRSKGKGQGVYSWGSNILQVSCNTFSSSATDLVQNHIVSNGTLPSQGACRVVNDESKKPANNRFEGAQPFNADVYALQEETGYLYYVENTQVPVITPLYKEGTANMTGLYVWNCGGDYNEATACPSLAIDTYRPLSDVLDSLDLAILRDDEEQIQLLLTKALNIYDQEDQDGLESLRLLNETPHMLAKWILAARYLAREQYNEAFVTLSSLPNVDAEEQEERALYELMLQLEADSSSFLDINPSMINVLESISFSNTIVSEEARGILHYLRGDGFSVPLPYEENGDAPIIVIDSSSTIEPLAQIMPNPCSSFFMIDMADGVAIKNITVNNLQGSEVAAFIPVDSSTAQYDVSELASGMYLVLCETVEGKKYCQKLIVQR